VITRKTNYSETKETNETKSDPPHSLVAPVVSIKLSLISNRNAERYNEINVFIAVLIDID